MISIKLNRTRLWQKTRLHTCAQIVDKSQQNGLANVPIAASGIHLKRYVSQITPQIVSLKEQPYTMHQGERMGKAAP